MSATLAARNLAAGFGDRILFRELSFDCAPGDRIGLIGPNGAGKTTLMRVLAGLDEPEAGTIALVPEQATIGYLPQETERRPGESVRAFIGRRTGVDEAATRMEAAAAALADQAPGADTDYSSWLDRWLALGGGDLDERLAAVTAEFALDPQAPMASLSGGQAARAGLAGLLLARYDIFLLDEPTNDLDLDGLDRLERFVREQRSGIVIVSHDREFLARSVSDIVELDLPQQAVNYYTGGYDAYLRERARARQAAREAYDEYSDTRDRMTERVRRTRQWAEQGQRTAKRADERDKFIRHWNITSGQKLGASASKLERALDRLDEVPEPRKEWELHFTIGAAPRSGEVVAVARDAVVRYPGFTLGPVTTQINWADRIAITGANGSGKSTLLGLLLGRIVPDEGSATLGASVRIGEVEQARRVFSGPTSLLETMRAQLPDLEPAELRTLLAKFDLRAGHVGRACDTLSPGERTRAGLAVLQARGVNLLVLDEPTNHLDLPAIEQLEVALADYPGTLLLVSHDRRLLDAVAVTRQFVVEKGQVREDD